MIFSLSVSIVDKWGFVLLIWLSHSSDHPCSSGELFLHHSWEQVTEYSLSRCASALLGRFIQYCLQFYHCVFPTSMCKTMIINRFLLLWVNMSLASPWRIPRNPPVSHMTPSVRKCPNRSVILCTVPCSGMCSKTCVLVSKRRMLLGWVTPVICLLSAWSLRCVLNCSFRCFPAAKMFWSIVWSIPP